MYRSRYSLRIVAAVAPCLTMSRSSVANGMLVTITPVSRSEARTAALASSNSNLTLTLH